jgi:hypothetical protein
VLHRDTLTTSPRSVNATEPFVLISLLEALDDYSGMGGASSWLSVGLHYDATTGDHSSEDRIKLLSHAVSSDPGNWAAQMAYRVMLDSTSDKKGTLWALVVWLNRAAGQQKPGDTALKLRMLYAAYATRLNWECVGLEPEDDPSPTFDEIKTLFNNTLTTATLDELFECRIRAAANAMFDAGSFSQPGLDLDPQTAYAHACHAAQSTEPANQKKALALLRFAGPRYQAKVADDVSMQAFAESRTYLDVFGASPRTDLTQLVPYSAAKDRLTSAGLTAPESLTSLNREDLADTAGISSAAAAAWLLRAQVSLAVPRDLYDFRLEIADALAEHGVVSPASLDALRADAPRRMAAAEDLVTLLKTMKAYTGADAPTVEEWLLPQ